jgi:hypothetical protein
MAVRDIARPQIDFRFGWKSGRATDISAMTEFDPIRDISAQFCCDAQPRTCATVC